MSEAPQTAAPRRQRSYGRKLGRSLRPAQRDLLTNSLAKFAVSLPADGQQVDPILLFPDAPSEIWLEIGFGAGEHLIGQALAHPEVGCIGCEPYMSGVAALLARAERVGLNRIRVFPNDACPLIDRLRPASIDRLFILFADPWPKRKHHKRRLIQPETVTAFERMLRPGAELLFATDDLDYARWTLALLSESDSLQWCARRPLDWRTPPDGWISTRYQQKALERNAPCVYLRFRRVLAG